MIAFGVAVALVLWMDMCAAQAPPLGFNTWNSIRQNVSAQFVRQSIDSMAEHLRAFGYQYVNIDDGWAVPVGDDDRWANGTVKIDRHAFPNGIAPLAEYAHSKGLLLGIYSDR